MKFKRFLAAAAACAVAAFSAAAMTLSSVVSAAETEIAYTGPGTDGFKMDDDGSHFRLNLYNIWGNNCTDINNKVVCENNISVTFTISGLKGSQNIGEDGSAVDDYYAVLYGTVGGNNYWNKVGEDTVTNEQVKITGDGQYTTVFNLKEGAEQIDCLLMYFNINVFNYDSAGNLANSGINVKIDKITTGGAAVPGNNTQTPTQAQNNNGNTQTPTQAQNNNGNTQTPTQAQNNSGSTGGSTSGGAVLGNSTQTNSASTGDAGVAVAVAGLVITAGIGAAAVAMKSRKK